MDTVALMGLVFTPIIAILCLLVHRKKQDKTFLYFGAAFVIYFLSYIIASFDSTPMLPEVRTLLRLVAYLTITLSLYRRLSA